MLIACEAASPEDEILRRDSSERLRSFILNQHGKERDPKHARRDWLVLQLRFGYGLTLKECGKFLGISASRVRQIEMRASRRAREFMYNRRIAPPQWMKHTDDVRRKQRIRETQRRIERERRTYKFQLCPSLFTMRLSREVFYVTSDGIEERNPYNPDELLCPEIPYGPIYRDFSKYQLP